MNEAKYPPLTAEKLAFFGTITASLSHELKNVLATINELAGLLSDLLGAAERGRPLSHDRLGTICQKVSVQVHRGEVLIGRLNRFSHSVDEQVREVGLRQLLSDIMDLTRRFAKLRQVELEVSLPEEGATITTDPFAFEHAVFLCLELALGQAAARRRIAVACEPGPPACRVVVRSADPFSPELVPAERLALLLSVAEPLGAKVGWVAEPGQDSIVLTFARG